MRSLLPDDVASRYRRITDGEVRSASFGLIERAQINVESDWRRQRRSFDDQAIFGPRHAHVCACGKYKGQQFDGIICDECGVRLTTPDVRRRRCAHLNLPAKIAHPLGQANDELLVLPVLPVAFVEARSGRQLLSGYERILRSSDEETVGASVMQLLEVLAPLLTFCDRWDMSDRLTIAHGMALKEAPDGMAGTPSEAG